MPPAAPLPDPVRHWATLSQAERDAAYDNAAAVPERDALVRRRDAQGERYRATHPAHLDIPYAGAERTKWDLFPARSADAPCLVFIHGGYWQMNRRENFAGFAEGIAAHGWSVALPGYTLAPAASLTTILGELNQAFDWLAEHAASRGIAGKMFLGGWSAGGHLAAALLGHRLFAGGLAISGIFELGPLRDTYLNTALKLTDEEVATLSPLRLPPVQKPLAIAYGTTELPALMRDSQNLHAHRAAAHAGGPLIPIPHANHFDVLEELRQPKGALARCLVAMGGR